MVKKEQKEMRKKLAEQVIKHEVRWLPMENAWEIIKQIIDAMSKHACDKDDPSECCVNRDFGDILERIQTDISEHLKTCEERDECCIVPIAVAFNNLVEKGNPLSAS